MMKKINPPRPVRFNNDEEARLQQLRDLTGLSISNIVRRSVQYATPRFLDGRTNLLTLRDERQALPLIPRKDEA